MNKLIGVYNFLKGKKTYIIGICAILYGYQYKDNNAIIIGLGLLGLRNGLSTEVAKIVVQLENTQNTSGKGV